MQVPQAETNGAPSAREALARFRKDIAGMLDGLERLAADPPGRAPVLQAGVRVRCCELAARIDETLQLHVQDEEKDVFPAVLAAADSPARRARAFEFVASLLVDQFDMVESWHSLRPALLALGGEMPDNLSVAVADFIARARRHIQREEAELSEMLAMIDDTHSRRIAISIAKRHETADAMRPSAPRES